MVSALTSKHTLYVVGHPVAHSQSPAMHNAAYAALDIPWCYGRKDLATDAEAQRFLEEKEWLALNITTPYKGVAFSIADAPSEYAVVAQGANVLIATNETLYADNTDGRGCISYLQQCGCSFNGASVVVCGTGPTSQSIFYAAARAGASSLYLLGRDSQKAQAVLDAFIERLPEKHLAERLHAGSYAQQDDALAQADVIIDATPLGMHEGDPAPFDTSVLHEGQYVMDVVYGHGTTALIQAAREQGCVALDGSGMLVAQAIETLYDLNTVLGLSLELDYSRLFSIMSEAAGFTVNMPH